MKKTDDELEARDAQRDIGSELLSSVREMMADKRAREHAVDAPDAATARIKIGLSQSEFATLLGVSKEHFKIGNKVVESHLERLNHSSSWR